MALLFDDFTVTEIRACLNVDTPHGTMRTMRDRSCSAFIFSSKGRVDYYEGARRTFTDPGHFIFVPEGCTYYLKGEEDDFCPCINFKCTGFPEHITQIALPSRNVLDEAFKITELYSTGGPRFLSYIRAAIYRIMQAVCQLDSEWELPKHIAASIAFIRENLSDPALTNERIAAAANISPVYLSKEFARCLNTSPHRYVQKLRLERAIYLLVTQNTGITEIAALAGYNSVYNFSRTFKTMTGLSPKEFRAKNRFNV